MKTSKLKLGIALVLSCAFFWQCSNDDNRDNGEPLPTSLVIPPQTTLNLNQTLVDQGKDIFRNDTFGDEALWTNALELDKAILGDANGGFGPGLDPTTALTVGLKVDATALPQSVVDGINDGSISLTDPMTTVALLSLDAIVGVKGTFDTNGNLTAAGITCALCHSTVDDSFTAGIGNRKDGYANTDLNVGAILGFVNNQPLADILEVDTATFNSVVNAWGPGRFSAALLLDGKATDQDGNINPPIIPPAYGLQDIEHATYTGWGDISYWNRFVAIIEMGGMGNFSDPRLNDAEKFPLAVARGLSNITVPDDMVDSKLAALREYQLSILAPQPDASSYDETMAIRGKILFDGKANCISCHSGPSFADNILRTPEEIGIDDFEADRSPTEMYRTPPLRGVFIKSEGQGFFHDGRFNTLNDVVTHYDNHFDLELTDSEQNDLVEYLKAL